MLIENSDALNNWLINYLEPICDADPQALAKYIMALIKKDKTAEVLKKICLDQLEVFLVNETNSFVQTLFEILENKNYLTKEDKSQINKSSNNQERNTSKNSSSRSRSKSPKNRITAPRNSSKRYSNQNSSYNKHLNLDSSSRSPVNRQRSRSPKNSSSSKKQRSRSRSIGKSFKRNKSDQKSPQRTDLKENKTNFSVKRCRDYDEKGYCMRGNLCLFDHGRNPVILDSVNASSVLGLSTNVGNNTLLPTPNSYTNNHINSITEPYNPESSIVDSHLNRNIPLKKNLNPLSQPYCPTSNDTRISNSLPNQNLYVPPRINHPADFHKFDKSINNEKISKDSTYVSKSNNECQNFDVNKKSIPLRGQDRNRNFYRQQNKRRTNTNFNELLEKTVLEVRKIPPNLNTIANLNEHFSKFGTIKNLQIGYDSDPEVALVHFSNNSEALAAYRSTEAILNNRFIKVFWHNSNQNSTNPSSNTIEKLNIDSEKVIDEKLEKKSSVKERLGVQDEKQALITKSVVKSLMNSGLINNTPNQLASLISATNSTPIVVSKPVFDPALLKKQYSSNSNTSLSSNSVNSVNTANIANTTSNLNTNSTTKTTVSFKEKMFKKLDLQKKRQEILATSVKERKLLLTKLDNAKTASEKQSINKIVMMITKQIKQLEEDIKKENDLIMEETNLQEQISV